MKKIVLLVTLIVVSQATYAFTWIDPIMNIKMSYNMSDSLSLVADEDKLAVLDYMPVGTIVMDFTVGADLLQYTWIEGQFKTYMLLKDWNPEGGMFSPFQMEYGFRAGFQFKGFRIGYEHWCYHPVSIYKKVYAAELYGGYDRLFLEYNIQRNK